MIVLKIKLKGEKQRYTQTEYMPDEFNVSKDNPQLLHLVQDAIDHCKIEAVETVKVTADLDM